MFSPKQPRPEEGKMTEKKHINEAQAKFNRILRWELLPITALMVAVVIMKNKETQVQNLLPAAF